VDGTDILRRNLFDSITGPLDGMPDITADLLEPPVEQTPDPEAEGVIPPRCEARLRLQACYSAPNHPDYSFAALSVDNEEKLVHVGDTVEDLRVAEITWRYVYMQEQGGSTCYVDLWNEDLGGEGAPPSMTSAPKTPAQKKAMGAKTASSPAQFQGLLNKSIKDVSPTEKDVDRSLIDYLVQNKQMLMQSGRVLPNVEGDEINGFKVYGIRKTSLWGKLGIHNGDVVLSVNELSMDGPDKAYEAFAGLSGTDTMDVKVLRHGKPMTFTYNIK
jgi:general secretion pathway protein C